MITGFNIYDWYWTVGDSSPGSTVYSSKSGAFVAVGAAAFQTWLASFGPAAVDGGVVATANNGSGLIKVTCGTTRSMMTGMYVYFRGDMSGVAAAFAITVNDGTHYTLQGSSFTVADGSNSSSLGATFIDTAADLNVVLRAFGLTLLPAVQTFYSVNAVTAAGNTTLTNPMSVANIITLTAGPASLTLPPMNQPKSLPLGVPFIIANASASNGNISGFFYNDGVTQVGQLPTNGWISDVSILCVVDDNSTANGHITVIGTFATISELRAGVGGTGWGTAPSAAQIPVGDGSGHYANATVSGDATINASAVVTLASTITAGGPTGDATHVAQITYDAKGRLTAVSSVAISGVTVAGHTVSPGGSTFIASTDLSDTANLVRTVKKQVFTSSGTYTPSSGMLYCIIECVGGGGGGGGATGSAAHIFGGSGGGSGGYSRKFATASDIGASKTVTIGAGGSGGAAGSNDGAAGGDTSVGTLCIGKGGSGGLHNDNSAITAGGAGGVAGTGDVTAAGTPGLPGSYTQTVVSYLPSGAGGSSVFGGGAIGVAASPTANGNNAGNYGSGGSGGFAFHTTNTASGGNGSAGVVIVTEFCNQ